MAADLGSMRIVLMVEDRMSAAIKKVRENIKSFNKRIKAMGLGSKFAFTALGTAAVLAFKTVIKWSAEFQKSLAEVSTMLNEVSMVRMKDFEEGLITMSRTYGEATRTLARGLYDILSAGIAASEALEVLEAAAKAAKAGLTDTGVAADAITTIMNAYADSAFTASQVSDMLFATVKRGKTTFDELAGAIGQSATLAAQAGIKFEELSALVATLTRAGINTHQAMTAVNGVIRGFLKPTKDAKDMAKKFGIEMNTDTLEALGLAHTMLLLKDATAEQLATIFPNIRGLKGVQGALSDLEGLYGDIELIMTSFGMTEEALGKTTATLGTEWSKLWQTMKTGSVETFKPFMSDLQREIGLINKLTGATKENEGANSALSEQLEKVREKSADFVELQASQIPTVEKFRIEMRRLTDEYGGQIEKLSTLKESLNSYLDVTKLEGYEEITDELRAKKAEIIETQIAMKRWEAAGQTGGETYEKLREKLERLRSERDLEILKLGQLKIKSEELDDVQSDIIDKNEEQEISYEELLKAVTDNATEQVELKDQMKETEKGMETQKEMLVENVIKPLERARAKVENLTLEYWELKKTLETPIELDIRVPRIGFPGAPEPFTPRIPERGGTTTIVNQDIKMFVPTVGEGADEILASKMRAG